MRTKSTVLLVIVLALAPALHAQQAPAQPQCELSDTVAACFERFVPNPGKPVTAPTATEAQTQTAVAAANTGISSLVSPSNSALLDFLSLLSASLESSSLTSNGQAITFDYNPPISILGADHALKLQAVFAKPDLNTQLTTHFAQNNTALTPFENDLTNTDDVAMSGTFQPTSERFGRSLRPHRATFRMLVDAVSPTRTQWQTALAQAVAASGLETEDQTFADLPADQQQQAMQAIETAGQQQRTFLRAVGSVAGPFARLLNNQPQLYATALYHARTNVVGPNEWTAKLTYEWGARNLNTFRKKYGTTCNDAALATRATAANCATLLRSFAQADDAADDRLSMSLEYHRTNRRWIKGDPDLQGFEFGYPRAHSFVYALTYGRTLAGAPIGANSGRLDVSVKYNDVRNPSDATQNVRSQAIASVTYTQKINDMLSIPLSLVYANHDSDLGDVNRRLNAHFGLVYKLPTSPFGKGGSK